MDILKVIIMKNTIIYFYLFSDFLILIGLLSLLFYKGYLHFKLLQLLDTDKFSKIKSYLQFYFGFYFLKADLITILWYFLPIYIPLKKVYNENIPEIKIYNKKLIRNNIWIIAVFLFYVIWIYISSR